MTVANYELNLVLTNGNRVTLLANDLMEVRPIDDDDPWIAEVFEVTTESGETYEVDRTALDGGTETMLIQAVDPD